MSLAVKYQPKSLDGLMFPADQDEQIVRAYANGSMRGGLILYGPYGTGKTTAAKVISETFLEGSGILQHKPQFYSGVDVGFDTMHSIRQASSLMGRHAVILDEVDRLSNKATHLLGDLWELTQKIDLLVILTTNHFSKMSARNTSRYRSIDWSYTQSHTRVFTKEMAKKARLRLTKTQIDTIVQTAGCDLRQVVQELDLLKSMQKPALRPNQSRKVKDVLGEQKA